MPNTQTNSNARITIKEKADNLKIHDYTPLKAHVINNGKKKPDELTVTLSMENRADEGDLVHYIEDVVDLTYLSAIWNFQLSCRDERGYDFDPTVDPPSTRFSEATANKFKGNYQLDFTAAGQEITIPNSAGDYKDGLGATVDDRLDLTGQFDIIIWFTPDTAPGISAGTQPVLFSRYSSGDDTGLEIGIDEDGATGNWYPYIRVGNGTTTVKTQGTTAIAMDEGVTDLTPRLVRVKRGTDDVIRMYAMGDEDATNVTVTQSLQSTTADIIFGSNGGGTMDYSGKLNQIRVYSGNTLTDTEYFKVMGVKYQPIHMKFGGTIWQRKDKTTTKELKAQSWSKDLNNFKLTPEAITQAPLSGVTRGAVGGLDAYYTGSANGALELVSDNDLEDIWYKDTESLHKLYILGNQADRIYEFDVTSNDFDLRNVEDTGNFLDVTAEDNDPKAFCIQSAGTRLWMFGGQNDNLYRYDLSVAHDVSSDTFISSGSFTSQTTSPRAGYVNGTSNTYVADNNTVYWFKMTTSNDPTSLTHQVGKDLSLPSAVGNVRGIFLDAVGDEMWIVDALNKKVHLFILGTVTDTSTAVLKDSFDVSSITSEAAGVFVATTQIIVGKGQSGERGAFYVRMRVTNELTASNRYLSGDPVDITEDIINNLDDSFLVRTKATMPADWTGSFLAEGTFSEIVNLLLVRSSLTFYITARKVIVFEDAIENGTKQKTQHEFYQLDPVTNTKTTGGQNLGGTAGVFNSYNITANDLNDTTQINEITLVGGVDETGEKIISYKKLVTAGDTVHSLVVNTPQLNNITDLDAVRDKIVDLSKNIKKSYKIVSPVNIHHVRFNHLIKTENAMIGLDSGFVKVEGIESFYPENKSIIHVNELPITFFELARNETKVLEQAQTELNKRSFRDNKFVAVG